MRAGGTIRWTADAVGVVQGVGFRPTLTRLARAAGLSGWVQNRGDAVRVVLEGSPVAIDDLLARLPSALPAAAHIAAWREVERSTPSEADRHAMFEVRPSERATFALPAPIPPDLAVCADCLREVRDPSDRRHGYAFTTCAVCGPRFSVMRDVPYDRDRTSMRAFPMCPRCREEYENPSDRRFHAEGIACPVCGPRLTFADRDGRPVAGEPLASARAALARGEIVAVRGIGGFLLAGDASRLGVAETLRRRKRRARKPLAIMASGLEAVRALCHVSPEEERLLASERAPMVLLRRRRDAPAAFDALAPDTATLGVMLPYSPLHALLFEPLEGDPTPPFRWLIMTSGNARGEPPALGNEEGLARLRGMADAFLLHDRPILQRADDSIVVAREGVSQVWRRGRGYAPMPIRLVRPLRRSVFAFGADMKNAVALASGSEVVFASHIGDLDTPEALDGLRHAMETLPRFLACEPDVVAVDLHPDMQSTRIGRAWAGERGLPVVAIQHHHAHAAACLAEHGREDGLALTFDGTGWGLDGTIWGAELLRVNPDGFQRLATFEPAPLPGGEAAIREPIRQLAGRWALAGADAVGHVRALDERVSAWIDQAHAGIHTPFSRSLGRVFDAFAAWMGIAPDSIDYEGQPAIGLEACALQATCALPLEALGRIRSADRDGLLEVSWTPVFEALAGRRCRLDECAGYARAFHEAVASLALSWARHGRDRTGLSVVALSGGVFMNRLLHELLLPRLRADGFEPLLHRDTPPGDGCLALGQAVIAGHAGR